MRDPQVFKMSLALKCIKMLIAKSSLPSRLSEDTVGCNVPMHDLSLELK